MSHTDRSRLYARQVLLQSLKAAIMPDNFDMIAQAFSDGFNAGREEASTLRRSQLYAPRTPRKK